MQPTYQPNANLDLSFTRIINVPRAQVWRAWTEPALLMPWFCPMPWKTIDCEIDLRPGGLFRTTMQSPEGAEFPNAGCYLEVVPQEKLVWTNALLPGFQSNRKVPLCEKSGSMRTLAPGRIRVSAGKYSSGIFGANNSKDAVSIHP